MATVKPPTPAPAPPTTDGGDTGDTGTPDQAERLSALFQANKGDEQAEELLPLPETEDDPPETSETAQPSEEPPEESPTEEPPAEEVPTYDVKVDGVVEKVTLDELKAGYSRTGHATRQWQEASTKQKEADAVKAQASQLRDRYIEGLKAVEGLLTQTDEPDWEKLANELEPVEFNRARAQYDTRQRNLAGLRAKREAEERQRHQEASAAHQQYLVDERAKLYAAIPEWKDAGKAKLEQDEIVQYALDAGREYGVTAESLAQIDSAFPMLTLRKAMLYDKLMAAKPKVQKQAVPTPRPGVKKAPVTVSPLQAARTRLAKTGDNQSAEEYFLQRILEGATR